MAVKGDSSKIIFVFGAPRSGTTLMYGMLLRDQEALGGVRMESFLYNRANTLSYSLETIQNWRYLDTLLSEIDENPAEILQRHDNYFDLFTEAANTYITQKGYSYYVEKSPIHTAWYDVIAKDFPDSKWVIIGRNPLANVHSLARTRSRWFNLGVDKLPFGLGEKLFFRYTNATVRYFYYWRNMEIARKMPNCAITAQYEDFVSDPEAFRVQLEAKLGVTMNPLKPITPISNVNEDRKRQFHTRSVDSYKEQMPGWVQMMCRSVFMPSSPGEHIYGVFLKIFMVYPGYGLKTLLSSIRKTRS